MLVLVAHVKDMRQTNMFKGHKKIKEWKLKSDNVGADLIERFKRKGEMKSGKSNKQKTVRSNIIVAAKISLWIKGDHKQRKRETWWWSTVVQQAISEKIKCYKKWQRSGRKVERLDYNERKRIAKRDVDRAKKAAWEE